MKSGGYTPLKNFLLEALIDGRLSQREMRILLALARRTYGWKEPGNPKRRMDRAPVSQSDLAEDTAMDPKHCSATLRSLIARNIVIAYEKGAGNRKGVYGIQSDTSAWIGASEDGPKWGQKSPICKWGQKSPTCGSERALFTDPKEPYLQCSTISSEASNGKGLRSEPKVPKENIKETIKETPIPPEGVLSVSVFPESEDRIEPVTTVKQALSRQAMPIEEALAHAERIYTGRFATPFSPSERMTLATYFEVSPFRGSLLSFWIQSVPKADADRRERKREPEKRRYVAKSPFRDCHQLAAEMYADAMAAKERKVGPAAAKASEIEQFRKPAAPEPREKSGNLLELYFGRREAQ